MTDQIYIAKQHFGGDGIDFELTVGVPLVLIRSGAGLAQIILSLGKYM